ncbi:MAG TPA: hypothetical protein VMT16_02265 [Thermoanaerobaculia bacterium]|nr:hypothetical protein [Thermoanaerobaculia bacterium]
MSRTARHATAAVLLSLALPAAGQAQAVQQTVEQTLRLERGQVLVLRNLHGGITAEGWERDEVRVVARKSVRAPTRSQAEEAAARLAVRVRRDGDTLLVETAQAGSEGGLFRWLLAGTVHTAVEYALMLPGGVRAELSTIHGNVALQHLDGRVDASSTHGNIVVLAPRGQIRANTINGNVLLELAQLPRRARLELQTVNGSIVVRAPPDLAAVVDARTTHGCVDSELPLEVEGRRSRSRMVGRLNGGGGQIVLRTTNGSISLHGPK